MADGQTQQDQRQAGGNSLEDVTDCHELARAGRFNEALSELAVIIAAAKPANDTPRLAAGLYEMAWCCMKLGKTAAGLDCIAEARRLWVRAGDITATARAMALESLLMLDVGLADEGYEEAEQAVSAAEMAGHAGVLSFARNVKACILAVCGQAEMAVTLLEECIAAAEEFGDRNAEAFYLLNMGFARYKLFEAAEYAGDAEQAIAELDRAVSFSERAIIVASACRDIWTLKSAIANTAELNARAGHIDRALLLLDQWTELPFDAGPSTHIHYLYARGDVLLRNGDFERALDACQEALEMAEANNQTDHQVNAVRKLADIYAAMGEHDRAFEFHKRFHALYVKQTGETARRRADTSAVRMETAQWRQKATQFADQALRDPLTGIANRRSFDQNLAELADKKLAIAIVDLDHFKSVNDSHSHIVGDQVLKRVAEILVSNAGESGKPARLGGEEFGLVFAGLDIDEAARHCQAIGSALSEADWSDLGEGLEITASIGVAAGDGQADTSTLMGIADQRLYAAKRLGRNRVVSDESDLADLAIDEPAPQQQAS